MQTPATIVSLKRIMKKAFYFAKKLLSFSSY